LQESNRFLKKQLFTDKEQISIFNRGNNIIFVAHISHVTHVYDCLCFCIVMPDIHALLGKLTAFNYQLTF
jgi:hypothetical protein